MAYLQLDGVAKSFGPVVALAPTTLTVEQGEFVVLVGPSGCGKSTLLRLIAGLEEPTAGTMRLDGRSMERLPPKDRDIAMVFQGYALYPHMTVRENIGFGLRMRRVPRAEADQLVAGAAAMLGLDSLLARKPGQLSGGQRQRVALGRAIVRRPKLFLLDEPLSNLDAALRTSTRAELVRLHQRLGATTIYVTHDQVEAMSMADRLVVLRDGVVQQQGAPLELYRRPVNRFVARFLGAPPMNLLPAEWADAGLLVAGQVLPALWRRHDGQSLLLGVRPEDVQMEGPHANGASLPATVVLVEALGSETLATCAVGGGEMVVRLPPHAAVHRGEAIRLRPVLERAVLFDAESGAALESKA